MNTISVDDGRVVAYEQWGDSRGQPMFFLHGTPGCRLSRHPDASLWQGLHLRVVTLDRPGYGESSMLPGRKVSHAANDVAAVADALGLKRFLVVGQSGGGPHALACASALGERVVACAPVASAAPRTPEEIEGLIAVNRESYRVFSEHGRTGMTRFLAELREQMLADPTASLKAILADAPPADIEWNERQDVQAVHREAMLEALRPGVDGWVADAVSIFHEDWDIELGAVSCSVRFWHSDDDRNAPLSSIQRLSDQVPDATLQVWTGAGHSGPARHMSDVLSDLVEHR